MAKYIKIIAFSFLIALIGSYWIVCDVSNNTVNIPSDIKLIIDKSKNKNEFYKVIQHYKNDSLKLAATYFLIRNMEDKYSILPSNKATIYKTALENIPLLKEENNWDPTKKSTLGILMDSLSNIEPVGYKKVYDMNVITAEFLIENIDLSFEVWENPPISKYYDFNIFCEYVLPYRFANEPLSNWRKNAYIKFKPILLDTSHITKDIAIQVIKKSQIHYNIGMAKYPYPLTFEEIDLIKWGTCEHLSQYQTLAFRSIGIPSTTDFIPVWANRSLGHEWCVFLNNDHCFEDIGIAHSGKNDLLYKFSKIYRKAFFHHCTPSDSIFSDNYKKINYLLYQDVTDKYGRTSDLTFSNLDTNSTYALCTFNNRQWIPVSYGKKKNGNICFHNMGQGKSYKDYQLSYTNEGKGVIYIIAKLNNNGMEFIEVPFILYEEGRMKKLKPDCNQRQAVILNRKYPEYEHFYEYKKNMLGATIEIANDSLFKDKKTIYRFTGRVPSGSHIIIDLPAFSSQYIRYKNAENISINLSGIHLFYNKKKLKSKLYSPSVSIEYLNNLSDDDILTYCTINSPQNYIDIDMGEKTFINQIEITCRTDDNEINHNETYELYYFNQTWISLGSQRAKHRFLLYEQVPSNALFLLKNKTKGVEQRIFTIENGEQIWW